MLRNLSDDQLSALYTAATVVAADAYRSGGASLYTFTGLHGDRSEFKHELKVYDKRTDPLGNKVERMETPDKRTTHWVPSLQSALPAPKITVKVTKRDTSYARQT